ncbi:hypothetical protein OIDMADRAFT_120324 [Oidiodendron maius Zn]|uniref:Heterokaryon incompatibility domain-containing protein n=1 Tax=Oidiodendron maius (strain Zn) TaxID=913774 RepID=A0A0C3H435_OIDMZ|nr:hypothetical protein OIDMADRAFT_120324 [Oidiodendron maius Zn]
MQPPQISARPLVSPNSVSCATRLCERCQKVSFDDGRHEGFVAISDTGSEYLKLDTSDGEVELDTDFELVDSLPDLEILTASAKQCEFCELLRLQLKESKECKNLGQVEINISLAHCWRNGSLADCRLLGMDAIVCRMEGEKYRIVTRLRFTFDAVDGPCKNWLGLQPMPPAEFLCKDNVSKIRELLMESDTMQRAPFFPTRVLDLGCGSKEEEAWPSWTRLILKEELPKDATESPPYVALSYCWGTAGYALNQTTLRSNIRDRMRNIDLRTVSIVVQEAVTVCRTFQIRYLWVDALCIIQDSNQDWEQESATMGDIFREAHFTIGVASSDSCEESFLSRSLPVVEFPFSSSISPNVRGTYRAVAKGKRDDDQWTANELEDMVGSWQKRGWVFQEIFLSQNLLIFGWNMMHAEFKEIRNFHRLASTTLDYDAWRALTSDYVSCQLTFPRDRLPAISGLAKIYAESLKDQYLAGLWMKDLHISLFWSSFRPQLGLVALCKSLEAPNPYVVPSWSWARQNRYFEIGFYNFYPELSRNCRPQCTVLEAGCNPVGLNTFGEVSSGYIVLSAKISPLQFALTKTQPEGYKYKVWQRDIHGRPAADFLLDWNSNDRAICCHELLLVLLSSCYDTNVEPCDSGSGHIVNNARDIEEQNNSDQSSSCDLEEDDDSDGSYGHKWCANCLVAPENQCAYGLILCPTKQAGKFYRVGLFYSHPVRHAPHGGLKFCESWETRKVTII